MAKDALIVTQKRYIHEPATAALGKRLSASVNDKLRNVTFGSIPHLGAYYLASYLVEQKYSVHLANLWDGDIAQQITEADVVMISAMDIGIDRTKALLSSSDRKPNKYLVGGYGAGPAVEDLNQQFPEVAVFTGECEGVMGQALAHLGDGTLMSKYTTKKRFNMSEFSNEPYCNDKIFESVRNLYGNNLLKVMELSRGCTEGCDFCPTARWSVSHIDINLAKRLIDRLEMKPWEAIFFVDQNMAVLPNEFLHQLFDYLNHKKIKWIGEGTITYPNMLKDEELLKKMATGCLTFLAGIEDLGHVVRGSAVKSQLGSVDKLSDLTSYLRDLRVPMLWSMIFGSDFQERGYGQEAANIVNKLKMNTSAHLVTPRPGTPLWDRLQNEDRIIDTESAKRNMRFNLVHKPTRMTRDEALQDFWDFQNVVYSTQAVLNRFGQNLRECGPQYASGLIPADVAYWASTIYYQQRYKALIAKPDHQF